MWVDSINLDCVLILITCLPLLGWSGATYRVKDLLVWALMLFLIIIAVLSPYNVMIITTVV